jgi:hypothetical protein
MTMVNKLDEERLVTIEWVKRIEGEVEKIQYDGLPIPYF